MPPILRNFKPGDVLFKEGQLSESIFIIKRGAISIRIKKGPKFVEVAKITAGEVIGELSFFDRQPRSASAIALMETEVLEISFESMEKLYASIPDYMKTIIASLAERLRKANDQLKLLQKGRNEDTIEE